MLNNIINSQHFNVIIIVCLFVFGMCILYFNNKTLSDLTVSNEDKEALNNIDEAINYLNVSFKGGDESIDKLNQQSVQVDQQPVQVDQQPVQVDQQPVQDSTTKIEDKIKDLQSQLKKNKELIQIAEDEYNIEKNIKKTLNKSSNKSKNKKKNIKKKIGIKSWDDMCKKKTDTNKYDNLKLDLNQSINLEPYNNDDFEDFANFTCK